MGRPAIYDRAMTGAQRQKRHRDTKRAEVLSAIALIRAEVNRLHRNAHTIFRVRHREELEAIDAAIDLAEKAAGGQP